MQFLKSWFVIVLHTINSLVVQKVNAKYKQLFTSQSSTVIKKNNKTSQSLFDTLRSKSKLCKTSLNLIESPYIKKVTVLSVVMGSWYWGDIEVEQQQCQHCYLISEILSSWTQKGR